MKKHYTLKFFLILFLIFIIFISLFIYGKEYIDSFNHFCFSFSGELVERKAEDDFSKQSDDLKKNTALMPVAKPVMTDVSSTSIDHSNPTTIKAEKTRPPKILYRGGIPDFYNDPIPEFPEMRTEKGEKWDKEKTLIKMTCDSKDLHVYVKCFDSNKEELVTKYSKNEGAASAWKDDSIEIFLMKDKGSKIYCQYIASASGLVHCFCEEAGDLPFTYSTPPLKNTFKQPEHDVNVVNDGFEITMTISLANLGIEHLMHGDKILMQIVRNYRGDGKDGISLQLFPCYIYADSRIAPSNHDRRAFIPVEIQK